MLVLIRMSVSVRAYVCVSKMALNRYVQISQYDGMYSSGVISVSQGSQWYQ